MTFTLSRNTSLLRDATALALLFLISSVLCILFTRQASSTVATLWLPNGLAIAWLLRSAPRRWPLQLLAVWLAGALAELPFSGDPAIGALYSLPNLAEILFGAWLLHGRILHPERNVAAMGRLLFYGVLVTPLAGTALGTLIAAQQGNPELLRVALHWYLGDALGLLVMMPLAFLGRPLQWRQFSRQGAREFIVLLLISPVLVLGLLAYVPYPFVYVSTLLLLMTLRLTALGTAVVGGLNILIFTYLVAHGYLLGVRVHT